MAIDLSGLPDQQQPTATAAPAVDFSGLPDQGQPQAQVGPLEDVQGAPQDPAMPQIQAMSPEDMSRTGQLGYEPSTVTAGTEPTAGSNALAAAGDLIQEQIPRTPYDYAKQVFPPLAAADQGAQIATGNFSSLPGVGSVQAIRQADETPAFSKERFEASMRTLMDLGMLAGAGEHGAPIEDIKASLDRPEAPANAPESPVARSDAENASVEPKVESQAQRYQQFEPTEQDLAKANAEVSGNHEAPAPSTDEAASGNTNVREALSLDELRLMRERNDLQLQNDLAKRTTGNTHPAVDERIGQINDELDNIANQHLDTTQDVPEGAFDTLRQTTQADVPEFKPQDEPRPTDQATTGTVGESAGQQPADAEQPASVGGEGEQAAGDEGGQPASGEGISIKNEATDALRQKYGLEPAVQEARRSLGDAWEKAQGVHRLDTGIGRRILDDIAKGKITAVDDVQVAHLTRETIDAVAERNAAADAVNEAKTPEELDSAKSRRELAEEHLQNVVDADKKVGTATARGLKARQMAAREDYSLTRMESRARAAYGRKLSPAESGRESAYVKGLHDKLQALSDRMDKMQDAEARSSGKNVLKEATQARKSGKKITDYTGEAAAKARERINRQLHGLGAKPAPPTLLADYAIVGADHLARGLTKFADWSAQMVKDFGDKVNPYLKDIWVRAKAIHNAANKAFRTPAEKADSAMQSRLATETVGLKAKMERGDFTKPTKEPPVYSKATYRMRQELSAMKGEFDRHVADIERKNATPGQKLVTHTAGLLRAGVLSSPGVVGKLGVAAAVKEGLAPVYGAARYGYSKIPGISKIAEASGRNPSLKGLAASELKAKASAITQGIIDAGQSFTKRGSELDRLSGKDKYTRYWYDKVTGAVHAAIKAPIKRAEFTRSLEQRIETSMRQGEDVSHPAVIDRLTSEAAIDANRQILQNANAFSNWISQLDRMGPAGKIAKAILAPVSRVPSNLVIEFWNHTLGVPHALLRSGIEGVKGIDDIAPATADSIMRQFSQGTVGLALASYAWYNHDKIGALLKSLPKWFQHTSQAMVLNLFSALGNGDQKEINQMATYDIPFVKTFTDLSEPLNNLSKPKWQQSQEPWAEYGRKQLASRAIPEVSNYIQKSEHTPGSLFEKSLQLNKPVYSKEENKRYFHPASIIEALKERLP